MDRSIIQDKWTDEQLQFMALGGNARAREYFTKHEIHSQPIQIKYNSSFAMQYREELRTQMEEM